MFKPHDLVSVSVVSGKETHAVALFGTRRFLLKKAAKLPDTIILRISAKKGHQAESVEQEALVTPLMSSEILDREEYGPGSITRLYAYQKILRKQAPPVLEKQ